MQFTLRGVLGRGTTTFSKKSLKPWSPDSCLAVWRGGGCRTLAHTRKSSFGDTCTFLGCISSEAFFRARPWIYRDRTRFSEPAGVSHFTRGVPLSKSSPMNSTGFTDTKPGPDIWLQGTIMRRVSGDRRHNILQDILHRQMRPPRVPT